MKISELVSFVNKMKWKPKTQDAQNFTSVQKVVRACNKRDTCLKEDIHIYTTNICF